jgi:hypothetical protein
MKSFKKFLEAEGKFDIINNDLKTEIKEYLLTNYPSDWWEENFQEKLPEYISEEDYIGNGDEEDESTWEYESPEDAYLNLCLGGAIEYDLIDEIFKNIKDKFHLTEDEYFNNGIDDIVEDHMCKMTDWYDKMLFGEESGDPFGMRKNIDGMMSNWNDIDDDGNGIKL